MVDKHKMVAEPKYTNLMAAKADMANDPDSIIPLNASTDSNALAKPT